jgi:AAA domain
LAAGKLTVIDATNVQKEARKPFLELAKSQNVLSVVIVLNLPPEICHERNVSPSDRVFGPQVVRQQVAQLKKSLRHLEAEGFRYRHVLSSPEEVEAAAIERQPLWNNRKWDRGPLTSSATSMVVTKNWFSSCNVLGTRLHRMASFHRLGAKRCSSVTWLTAGDSSPRPLCAWQS